ncbi:MAG TPA: hypothetical protein VKM94_25070 [Blastocatellia bacterium]|nr:hypothetical protein [Blastocatellia bacterium]
MKNKALAVLILLSSAVLVACGNRKAAPETGKNMNSNAGATASAPSSGAQAPPSPGAPAPAQEEKDRAPRLAGTYVVSEVQRGGVVSLFTQRKTFITFFPDGTYARVSKNGKTTYHSDSGSYRTEGDSLILKIMLSQGQIFQPAREVKHAFVLGQNGEELTLTSAKGSVAVFRKTTETPN